MFQEVTATVRRAPSRRLELNALKVLVGEIDLRLEYPYWVAYRQVANRPFFRPFKDRAKKSEELRPERANASADGRFSGKLEDRPLTGDAKPQILTPCG
jgi:hypothetical protein